MNDKILLLCPTRERVSMCEQLKKNIDETKVSDFIDVVFVLDEDDSQIEKYKECGLQVLIIKNLKPGLVYPLNSAYELFKDKYSIFGFIGDDVSFHTKGWDLIIYNKIKEKNYDVVAYGNDMLRGDCLLTGFFIGHKFLNKIGYMAYPKLNHVYVDTFWRLVAAKVNKLLYFPNLIIKHDHYTINSNTSYDNTYERTSKYAASDEKIYFDMQNTELESIVEILK